MSKIGPFDDKNETFDCYIERLECYFVAHDTPNEKKASTLIGEIGRETYKLLRSLIPRPAKPSDKTYDELVTVLANHLSPKPLVIAERFKFYRRTQQHGESVAQFAAELRHLASTCDFGDFFDEALRDIFVCGLYHAPTQKSLLTKDNLTFAKALELASAIELAEDDARALRESSGPSHSVNRVQTNMYSSSNKMSQRNRHTQRAAKPEKGQAQKCYRCGKGRVGDSSH